MIAREAKTLLEGLLRRFGFVPVDELEKARKQTDYLISKIEEGRHFEIVRSGQVVNYKVFVDTEIIVHGNNIKINNCKFRNSHLMITEGSSKVRIDTNAFDLPYKPIHFRTVIETEELVISKFNDPLAVNPNKQPKTQTE